MRTLSNFDGIVSKGLVTMRTAIVGILTVTCGLSLTPKVFAQG